MFLKLYLALWLLAALHELFMSPEVMNMRRKVSAYVHYIPNRLYMRRLIRANA